MAYKVKTIGNKKYYQVPKTSGSGFSYVPVTSSKGKMNISSKGGATVMRGTTTTYVCPKCKRRTKGSAYQITKWRKQHHSETGH